MATNHRRSARGVRSNGEDAPLPKQPTAPVLRIERHSAEPAAINIRHTIVPGEALIEEGVIGLDQIEDTAVLAKDTFKKPLGFLAKACRRLSSKSGNSRRSGVNESRFRR